MAEEGVRRSIRGSISSFLGRAKSSTGRSPDDEDQAASSGSRSTPRSAAVPIAQQTPPSDRSPLVNRSGPTRRRPVAVPAIASQEPPPPYSALPAAGQTVAPAPPAPTLAAALRAPSPAPSTMSQHQRLTVNSVRSNEDEYTFLSLFDTVFVIDDSGSMAGRSWNEVMLVLAHITPICTERDKDGIDIYFLNHRSTPSPGQGQAAPRVPPGKASGGYLNVNTPAAVGNIFSTVAPTASTPTGFRLRNILQPYLGYYEAVKKEMRDRSEYDDPDIKPVNIIVITDGAPTDDVEPVLINAAKKLDELDAPPYQVGIQFFQVGNEPDAATYLKRLDDHLGEGTENNNLRDIVDTVTFDTFIRRHHNSSEPRLTAEGILKAVLGAVVKRIDNQPSGDTRHAGSSARAA